MINVQSSGVIGTAGVLALGVLANPALSIPNRAAGNHALFNVGPLSQTYVAAAADSSRSNTVWIAVNASTVPSHADFQKLATALAARQRPLGAEFDVLLTDFFEELLD